MGGNTSLEGLEKEILSLKDRISRVENSLSIIVPIDTLSPEPYEILRPFHAVVRQQDEEYIASLFDANLGASGDTPEEAVWNLKDIIIGTYQILLQHEEDKLGPGPARQRKVLQSLIRKQS